MNQKLKCLIQISNKTLYSGLCRSTNGISKRFRSSWLKLYQLCIPGFGQFLLFFLTGPLRLRMDEEGSVKCHLQVCSKGFKFGLWLFHSITFSPVLKPLANPLLQALSRLCASGLYLAAFILPSVLTSLPIGVSKKYTHSMKMTPQWCTMPDIALGVQPKD